MSTSEIDHIDRIRAEVAENLKDSVWYVDGQRIEAADRYIWLDMKYLLDSLDVCRSRHPFPSGWNKL